MFVSSNGVIGCSWQPKTGLLLATIRSHLTGRGERSLGEIRSFFIMECMERIFYGTGRTRSAVVRLMNCEIAFFRQPGGLRWTQWQPHSRGFRSLIPLIDTRGEIPYGSASTKVL